MSFFTAQDHVPLVPSPLNPFAPPRRRRHSLYRGRIPMSPSEKLLRRKAAEAWKSEIIYRQVAEFERRAVEGSDIRAEEDAKVVYSKSLKTEFRRRRHADWVKIAGPRGFDDDERYSLEGALDRAEALQFDQRHTPARYKFLPISSLRFLTPKRLIRYVGFWRVFTPRRMKSMFTRERVEVN